MASIASSMSRAALVAAAPMATRGTVNALVIVLPTFLNWALSLFMLRSIRFHARSSSLRSAPKTYVSFFLAICLTALLLLLFALYSIFTILKILVFAHNFTVCPVARKVFYSYRMSQVPTHVHKPYRMLRALQRF
jgi:hypothetical protein